jgi:hypothetical protein
MGYGWIMIFARANAESNDSALPIRRASSFSASTDRPKKRIREKSVARVSSGSKREIKCNLI